MSGLKEGGVGLPLSPRFPALCCARKGLLSDEFPSIVFA